MKKTISKTIPIITGFFAFTTLFAGKVLALSAQQGAEAAKTSEMPTTLVGPTGTFTKFTNTILFVVGIVSVLMIIWGGFRYVISGGDEKKVTDAKNTVLYAIVGLVVSLLSYAVVNFVINAVSPINS